MPFTCFVPKCDSGYKTCATKRAIFSAPKDPKTFETWKRKIPRDGFNKNSKVCEIHFNESDILRFYETTLPDGTCHRIPFVRPRLKPGSIPCIFPKCPKYLSQNQKGCKRKAPKERSVSVPCKKSTPPEVEIENYQN